MCHGMFLSRHCRNHLTSVESRPVLVLPCRLNTLALIFRPPHHSPQSHYKKHGNGQAAEKAVKCECPAGSDVLEEQLHDGYTRSGNKTTSETDGDAGQAGLRGM